MITREKTQTRTLFYTIILGLFVIAVVPKFDEFIAGIKDASSANLYWLIAAALSFVLTYVSSAYVYVLLAKKRINFIKTIMVQIACSFTNRLLPGGLGGAGLNADYLVKNKHKSEQAASVVVMNTLVALVSHIFLIGITVALNHNSLANPLGARSKFFGIILAVVLALILIILIIYKKSVNKKLNKLVRDFWRSFVSYKSNLDKVVLAVGGASITTFLYVFCLFACANAVNLQASIVQIFFVYTAAVATGAVIALPGGLVGFEAGLYTGLITYHNVASVAFSAIIIFRLIMFWLPILPGYIVFALLRKRKVI